MPRKSYAENANGALSGGRLCETDVRKIFTCVKEGKTPPEHIAFNIIKTPGRKLMLSPPSFEFGGECIAIDYSHDVFSRVKLC